ncbi:MAG: DUF2953 domain-containing protein [bacterium]
MYLWAAAFLGCLLILLSIPLDITFSIKRFESFQGRISIGLIFGIIPLPLPRRAKKGISAPGTRKKREKLKRGLKNIGRVSAMLKSQGFWQRLMRFLKALCRAMRIHMLSLSVRLGLDDPADTGQLWAFIGPAASFLASSRFAQINIEPEFTSAAFSMDAHGVIRLIPLRFLFIITTFLLSPATLRALWMMGLSGRK